MQKHSAGFPAPFFLLVTGDYKTKSALQWIQEVREKSMVLSFGLLKFSFPDIKFQYQVLLLCFLFLNYYSFYDASPKHMFGLKQGKIGFDQFSCKLFLFKL